jgi:hypothetical protein
MSVGGDPYATALVFTRYLEQAPLERAPFVERLRREQNRPGGFNPYAKFCAACRAGFRFGGHIERLEEAISTVNPRYRSLYRQLTAGYSRYLDRMPDLTSCSEEKVRETLVARSGLTLKLNPHLGVRRADRSVEATYLWFDAQRPQPENIAALIWLMALRMNEIRPSALPVVLDVRRGEAYRTLNVSPAKISRYVDGQAAAFLTNWSAVA